MATRLPLDTIRAEIDLQPRVELSRETVDEYADLLTDDPHFDLPPVVVFLDEDGVYWLGDGFHRKAGYRKAGRSDMPVDIRKGTRRDALQYSLSANDQHGLRRSNDDKRKAVRTALDDPEWSKLSDNSVAKLCAVSQPFVSGVRRSLKTVLSENGTEERAYTTRHGTTATMNTANIGRRSEPEEEEEPAPANALADLKSRVWYGIVEDNDAPFSMGHARDAGRLLAEARDQIGAAGFWDWFDEELRFSRALARSYLDIFDNWEDITTIDPVAPKNPPPGGRRIVMPDLETLRYDVAIREFGGDFDPRYEEPLSPVRTPRPVCMPLAILNKADLLDSESVEILLAIRDDLGNEVLQDATAISGLKKLTPSTVWDFLFALRPLDVVDLFPADEDDKYIREWLKDDEMKSARGPILKALRWLEAEITKGRKCKVPRWQSIAVWYACVGICHHALIQPTTYTLADTLRHYVARWREFMYSGLVTVFNHFEYRQEFKDPLDRPDDKFGLTEGELVASQTDLVRAGVADALTAILDKRGHEYPALAEGLARFSRDLDERGTCLRATGLQREKRSTKDRETIPFLVYLAQCRGSKEPLALV